MEMMAAPLARHSARHRLSFLGKPSSNMCARRGQFVSPCRVSAAFKIRQMRDADIPHTAALCLEVFGSDGPPNGSVPSWNTTGAQRTQRGWETQLKNAVDGKLEARREARLHALVADAVHMSAELASLQRSTPTSLPPVASTADETIQQRSWRMKRLFACFIAESYSPSNTQKPIAGCIAISLARPEAALPAPFPTRAPLRCYVSNMAVLQACRGQGIASLLLAKAERTARAWGFSCVWLHVDRGNDIAEQLYRSKGYVEVKTPFWGSNKRRLLRKSLPPWRTPRNGEGLIEAGGAPTGRRNSSGTFIWDITFGQAQDV